MIQDLSQVPLRYGNAYDELSADGVSPRPHWAQLIKSLNTIGPNELGRRWARAERRIRENGITYNMYSDPLGANRPWRMQLVADGHLPAPLLFANPAFLRPLVGVRVPAHSYLHMLAVDLARSPDGQWWVLADLFCRTCSAPRMFCGSLRFSARSARLWQALPNEAIQESFC
jgi:uncharacterized circularly permuted ATP-grasp superfamily protein